MDQPFPAYRGDDAFIYVSYAHKDAVDIYPEISWLNAQGINIWYDEGISPGSEWSDELANAVKDASALLFFGTPNSASSENCVDEISFALNNKTPVLSVYLQETSMPVGMQMRLDRHQAIMRYELSESKYREKLLSGLYTHLGLNRSSSDLSPSATQTGGDASERNTVPSSNQSQTIDGLADSSADVAPPGPTRTSASEKQADIGEMYSIVVIPFANMSTNQEIGFLADGLSEDILDNLKAHRRQEAAQSQFLRVASRSASFQFTERQENPAAASQKLSVAYLLEGSVRQQGEKVRITAQLIRLRDGFHVWSESYERTFAKGFEMQTEVAVNIALVTRCKLNFDIQSNYAWKQRPDFAGVDPDAARQYWLEFKEYEDIRFGNGGDWNARVTYLQKAVEIDSNFYLAYGRLASAYYTLHQERKIALKEAKPAAHSAITHAINLAPNYPMNWYFLGQYLVTFDLDYARASAKFEALLSLDPKMEAAILYMAGIALAEGRSTEAVRLFADVSELDVGPDTVTIWSTIALIRNAGGDLGGALEASIEGLKLVAGRPDRAFVLWMHAFNLVMSGRADEAKPFIEEGWKLDRVVAPERYISMFTYIGDVKRSKSILSELSLDLADPFYLALGFLSLREIDNTFKSIKAGIEEQCWILLMTLRTSQWWNPIRDDPRFDEMLELLDSKVTHTEQYLRDHNIVQTDQ